MNWVCPVRYATMKEAILGMAQQSELELLDPKPVNPDAVAGIPDAAQTILTAIKDYAMPVVIVGDYDADGITSTAILTRLLRYFGCDPHTIIPKRFTDGYGVSSRLLEGVQNSLIITVDNGISAGDVLDRAVNEGGNIAVVLDHHLPDGRQPKWADVIVDPHLDPDGNGFTDYCGAGLSYKLAEYMLKEEPLSIAQKVINDILVLACFGTIADGMPIIGDNRRIVMDAISLINSGRAVLSKGIARLLSIGGADGAFDVETVAYTIAPLINAPGRLYNAGGTSVLKMLMCDNEAEAMTYGTKMVEINKSRQAKVREWMKAIQDKLSGEPELGRSPIVVFEPDMPEGLLGLVAGKLSESYHLPSIVMVRHSEGIVKGSVRTYGQFNVKDMLDSMQDLLTSYGGHAGAGGISLPEENLCEFQTRVAEYYNRVCDACGGEYVKYDVELRPEDVPEALEAIKKFQPFGNGVPKPVCRINGIPAENNFLMGSDKSHIKFACPGFDAVAFGMAEKYPRLGRPSIIDVVGTIGENSFQGRTSTQVILSDFRAH